MIEKGEPYTCGGCNKVFIAGWSHEEAQAEALENFGDKDNPVWFEGSMTVCDGCYNIALFGVLQ
jgi:hypothetical protein